MAADGLRSYVASKLRLLVAVRFVDLLFIAFLLSSLKVILYFTVGINSDESTQPTIVFNVARVVLGLVVFPGCLLTVLYINKSVLRSETVSLWKQCRIGFGDVIEFIFLAVIEFGLFAFPLSIVALVLEATHVVQNENPFIGGIVLVVSSTFGGLVFLFSIPLLVGSNLAYLKNVRKSLALFKEHKADILGILPFAVLIGAARLPERLHIVSRSADVLIMDIVAEAVTVVFYVIAMNCHSYYEMRS